MVQRLDFSPPLPSAKAQLLQRWGLGYYTKVVCVYKRAFWRLDGYSGETLVDGTGHRIARNLPMYSHLFTGSVITMTTDAVTVNERNEEVSALLAFVLGDPGRKWAALSEEDRRKAVLADLRQLFDNEEALYPIDYREQDWAQEKFSGGCPAGVLPAGALTSFAADLKSSIKSAVFFAGTEQSLVWNGYMDGAVSSGKEAAQAVLTALKGTTTERSTQATSQAVVERKYSSSFFNIKLEYLLVLIVLTLVAWQMA